MFPVRLFARLLVLFLLAASPAGRIAALFEPEEDDVGTVEQASALFRQADVGQPPLPRAAKTRRRRAVRTGSPARGRMRRPSRRRRGRRARRMVLYADGDDDDADGSAYRA